MDHACCNDGCGILVMIFYFLYSTLINWKFHYCFLFNSLDKCLRWILHYSLSWLFKSLIIPILVSSVSLLLLTISSPGSHCIAFLCILIFYCISSIWKKKQYQLVQTIFIIRNGCTLSYVRSLDGSSGRKLSCNFNLQLNHFESMIMSVLPTGLGFWAQERLLGSL